LLSLSPAFPEINRDHRALTFLYGTEDRQDRPGSEAVRYRHNATARLSSHCGFDIREALQAASLLSSSWR
jgi:hypothetical protein